MGPSCKALLDEQFCHTSQGHTITTQQPADPVITHLSHTAPWPGLPEMSLRVTTETPLSIVSQQQLFWGN